jgi:hypothetical protein
MVRDNVVLACASQDSGVYGHSWFVDPAKALSVVAFTNTACEGMNGAFVGEIQNAVYG